MHRTLAGYAAFTALVVAAFQSGTAAAEQMSVPAGSDYLYGLTAENAVACQGIHLTVAQTFAETDPEMVRKHEAFGFTWMNLAQSLGSESQPESFFEGVMARVNARLPDGELTNEELRAALLEQVRDCDIISTLHEYEEYRDAETKAREAYPYLFEGDVTNGLQTGQEPAPAPTKEMVIGDWLYSARGNVCLAAHVFEDGSILTLQFTNFNDGEIVFESEQLPFVDLDKDDMTALRELHWRGPGGDEPNMTADGKVDYDTFEGSGIFGDDIYVAGPSFVGRTEGKKYLFGQGTQSSYYTTLAGAQEISVKVLGEETHRVAINPDLWNEMSNCVTQYPYG